MFPRKASERLCAGGCVSSRREPAADGSRRLRISFSARGSFVYETAEPIALRGLAGSTLHRCRGFTLLELLIVVGIIAVLLVLIAPAFTTIKGAGDVTNAAYTIKGMLDTARTY